MPVITSYLTFETSSNYHMVEITGDVAAKVSESKLKSGTVTLFVIGSTGGLTTIEYESGLIEDMEELFERIAPSRREYNHNRRWHDGNGHSHVRATLLGPSLVVPFVNGDLTLGTWQQIIFIDFDVPARTRKVVVQIMGE